MARTEIKISGYGGQGVITLGKLITATVIMHMQNTNASQSESYGAAARGGACWSEVVIDDDISESFIDYPRTVPGQTDIGIFLSEQGAGKYLKEVKKKGGIVIYDPIAIDKIKTKKAQTLYKVEASRIANEELKMPVTANVILFGAFVGLAGVLSVDAAKKTVEEFVPKKFLDINIKAFDRGVQLAQELKTAT